MREGRRWAAAALFAALLAAWGPGARANFIVSGPFGPNGEGGSVNGQGIAFGSTGSGSIFEIDAFVNVQGQDLHAPGDFGTSRRLSAGAPAGFGYSFSSTVTGPQLILTYQFVNQTGSALPGFQFFSFVDPDINNFDQNYGTVAGAPGPGIPDPNPHTFQIDEPGFGGGGTIYNNLRFGALDNTNHTSPASPQDVAMALGFSLGTLYPNYVATIQVVLSDDGSSVGSLALTQHDASVPPAPDTLTMSGQAMVVPEPGSLTLLAFGGLASATGWRRRDRGGCPTT
jgi:hypothetical protein